MFLDMTLDIEATPLLLIDAPKTPSIMQPMQMVRDYGKSGYAEMDQLNSEEDSATIPHRENDVNNVNLHP